MRDDQFSEGVKRALYGVSTSLEQAETRHFLEEDAAAIEASIFTHSGTSSNPTSLNYSFTTPEGLQADLTLRGNMSGITNNRHPLHGQQTQTEKFRILQETIKGQYLYQKGLLNEVVFNILSQSSNRPINERADSAAVSGYLTEELANNGLPLPFEFAVVNRSGRVAVAY